MTVFLTAQGEPFSRDHLSWMVRTHMANAKIGKIGACHLMRHAMVTALWLAAPALVAGMVVGLVIGLLQAVTQVQEQAVAFVPKLIVVAISFIAVACIYSRLGLSA